MKLFQIPILTLLLFYAGMATAQLLSPNVVSTSGGFYSNDSGMLSFTTAEMSTVSTFTTPSIIITQGFQQYWDLGTYIREYPDHHISFGIYPNPSDGLFTLFTDAESNQYVDARILDIWGKEILRVSYYLESGNHIETVDLSNAAPGIYIIALSVKGKNTTPAIHFTLKLFILH